MPAPKRPGAIRKNKKGPLVGTGGHGRKALEGKGPTPRAEDRPYHKAHKLKQAAERRQPQGGRSASRPRGRGQEDLVTGRNSVLEALRADIPAKALHTASRIDVDDRVREILQRCAERGIPILEASKQELDRLTGDAVHQGVALQVPAYEYGDAVETGRKLMTQWEKRHISRPPLMIALDGITDPRNLGAILRSVSAFSGNAVVVPERRSVGVTASAWKTSAGAAARVPVLKAPNLNRTIEELKRTGWFVVGLDGDGDVELPGLELATEPLVVVAGSEGKGLSRLVAENCDQIVSIPIDSTMESLNASMAVGIALYEISRRRAGS